MKFDEIFNEIDRRKKSFSSILKAFVDYGSGDALIRNIIGDEDSVPKKKKKKQVKKINPPEKTENESSNKTEEKPVEEKAVEDVVKKVLEDETPTETEDDIKNTHIIVKSYTRRKPGPRKQKTEENANEIKSSDDNIVEYLKNDKNPYMIALNDSNVYLEMITELLTEQKNISLKILGISETQLRDSRIQKTMEELNFRDKKQKSETSIAPIRSTNTEKKETNENKFGLVDLWAGSELLKKGKGLLGRAAPTLGKLGRGLGSRLVGAAAAPLMVSAAPWLLGAAAVGGGAYYLYNQYKKNKDSSGTSSKGRNSIRERNQPKQLERSYPQAVLDPNSLDPIINEKLKETEKTIIEKPYPGYDQLLEKPSFDEKRIDEVIRKHEAPEEYKRIIEEPKKNINPLIPSDFDYDRFNNLINEKDNLVEEMERIQPLDEITGKMKILTESEDMRIKDIMNRLGVITDEISKMKPNNVPLTDLLRPKSNDVSLSPSSFRYEDKDMIQKINYSRKFNELEYFKEVKNANGNKTPVVVGGNTNINNGGNSTTTIIMSDGFSSLTTPQIRFGLPNGVS